MSKAMIMNMGASYTPVVQVADIAYTTASNGASVTVSLTDVAAGDIILCYFYVASGSANKTSSMSLSSSGYTELASGFKYGGLYGCNCKIFGKIADGTETSVITNDVSDTTTSVIAHAIVVRGAEATLPTTGNGKIIEFVTTSIGSTIYWPLISSGAGSDLIILSAGVAHATGFRYFALAADVDYMDRPAANDSYDLSTALAYLEENAGNVDPSNWFVSVSNSIYCGQIRSIIRLSV